jgi:hypothetical protein
VPPVPRRAYTPSRTPPRPAGQSRYHTPAAIPLDWVPHEPAGKCRVEPAGTSRRARTTSRSRPRIRQLRLPRQLIEP